MAVVKANGVNYEAMTRADLVRLAKERGIKASGKTIHLIKSLNEWDAAVHEPMADKF